MILLLLIRHMEMLGGGNGRTERDLENGSTGTRIHKLGNAGAWSKMGGWSIKNGRNMGNEIRKKIVAWDVAPGDDYFKELFRISRNQVIWGGELFSITTNKRFPDMAQNKCTTTIQYGHGRIRMDVISTERKGV